MAAKVQKRERKANFTDIENKVLIANVQKHSKILFGKIPFAASVQQKQLAWLRVTRAVNAVSTENRTLEEVRNRWKKHKQSHKRYSKFCFGQLGVGSGLGDAGFERERADFHKNTRDYDNLVGPDQEEQWLLDFERGNLINFVCVMHSCLFLTF